MPLYRKAPETNTKAMFQQLVQLMGKMQTSLDRIASQNDAKENGIFPAQPQANPRGTQAANITSSSNQGNIKYAKTVITLRSGKIIDNDVIHSPPRKEE